MIINSVRFINFKCFKDQAFSLASRFNLVIGDNGAGKTTVLDGLAIALGTLLVDFPRPATSRSIHRNEVHLRFFMQGETLTAEPQFPVDVTCRGNVDNQEIEWTRKLTSLESKTTRQDAEAIRSVSKKLHHQVANGNPVTLPVISYYGTGRLWVNIKAREIKTLSPVSRFMGYLDCLNPASDEKRLLSWFKTQEITALQRGQPSGTLEACRRAILICVKDAQNIYYDISRDQLMLRFSNKEIPFSQLSDGYRNMLGMVADIAIRCATLNPFLEAIAIKDTPGVILIDEIDLHLHPKWQRKVISHLLEAFPKIQFIATTHSPFIIQSLPPHRDVRLHNLDDPQAEDFTNKSVEDITESVQGVELPQRSQRYLDMFHAAEEYFRLLREAPNAPEAEKQSLSKRLDELINPFSDDPAYEALLKMQREASFQTGGQN